MTNRPVKRKPQRGTLKEPGKQIIGWREWASFPDLGIDRINAKIDTGARTSALHAYHIRQDRHHTGHYVEFTVHPVQRRRTPEIKCRAPLIDERVVTSSNGVRQIRYTVEIRVTLGGQCWPIEVTLTDRDEMTFRMLIGRQALRKRFIVDPAKSYCFGN